jgi:hypothetical protein
MRAAKKKQEREAGPVGAKKNKREAGRGQLLVAQKKQRGKGEGENI